MARKGIKVDNLKVAEMYHGYHDDVERFFDYMLFTVDIISVILLKKN